VAVTAGLGVAVAGQRRAGWLDAVVDSRVQSALLRFPSLLNFLADTGSLLPVSVMTVALVLACAAARRWRGAVLAAVAEPAASALTEFVLKPGVGRIMGTAYSYPSGHATGMFALAGTCAVLLVNPPARNPPARNPLARRVPPAVRVLLASVALLAATAVAIAMIALGAHYFTDAIAGAAVGTGMVLACSLSLDRLRSGSARKGARMSSSPEQQHLDNHHRNTLRQIFAHPASHNIEWHAVTSLLEAVGTVTAHHDGKVTVTVGSQTQIFDPPAGKDIDTQLVVDLRRMLSQAGYEPS
jgi:membrane-associated phospholipid phosphatase